MIESTGLTTDARPSRSRSSILKSYDFERDYARKIREDYLGDKMQSSTKISPLSRSLTSMSTSGKEFLTLPESKTLIHAQPWSYGKVASPHYPFRDSRITKHRK